jgi:hypothetical protein
MYLQFLSYKVGNQPLNDGFSNGDLFATTGVQAYFTDAVVIKNRIIK